MGKFIRLDSTDDGERTETESRGVVIFTSRCSPCSSGSMSRHHLASVWCMEAYPKECILSATCPFFRQQLQKSRRIELKGYNKSSVHFLLCFLYGGLTAIPDEVDTWEVLALATHLNLKDLIEVVSLHLKATKCHWFHRPCAVCVSAVFDALPQFYSIRCLKPLYEEAIQWQAKYFARIWKGRGLALNLGILEDILPTLVHSLSADVAIKSYLGLADLLTEIQSVPPSPKKTLSIPIDEWSPRFYVLVRRLYELVDKHLLHYAASVVRAEAWNLLNERDQVRIRETGIFVEMRQPKASMPRFSSNNRKSAPGNTENPQAYKRSASAGVQMGHLYTPERGRSLERHKPLTMIQQKARDPESEPIEDEKEVFEEPKPSTSAEAAEAANAYEGRKAASTSRIRNSQTAIKPEFIQSNFKRIYPKNCERRSSADQDHCFRRGQEAC
ncbi:unnamed protein product, partial [Mesorhabditis spiculigera]